MCLASLDTVSMDNLERVWTLLRTSTATDPHNLKRRSRLKARCMNCR